MNQTIMKIFIVTKNSKMNNPIRSISQRVGIRSVSISSACVVLSFLSFVATAQAVVWDSLQSYANNQVLATNSLPMGDLSSPWGRFGAAVAGNPIAKTSFGPYQDTAGLFDLNWSLGSNATLIFNFPAASNLVATPGFSVKLMANYAPPATNTLVYGEFQDSLSNIWRTKVTSVQLIPLAYSWQTFSFNFTSSGMDHEVGTNAFDLSAVTTVRIRFENTSGDGVPQFIYFDDLQSYPATVQSNIWDSFQSYTNGQVLATVTAAANPPSPWGRFGAATAANPVAKTNAGPNGDTVAVYPIKYSLGNNANFEYHFSTPINITANPGFGVKLMVTNVLASNTLVQALFEQTNAVALTTTIWQCTSALPLTVASNWQTYVFNFNPASGYMFKASGSDPIDLTSVIDIRLRFFNGSLDTNTQSVFLDDFEGYPAKPLATVTIPHPVITGITVGSGSSVVINFTSSDNSPSGNFMLQTNAVLSSSNAWSQDTGASIISTGIGTYQATTTGSGTKLFYRIRR